MSQLILVRHGQSEWNQQNLFTGWRDPDLTDQGVTEARNAGRALKAEGITFDIAFTSELMRAQKTLSSKQLTASFLPCHLPLSW